jgi:hypothetical protein
VPRPVAREVEARLGLGCAGRWANWRSVDAMARLGNFYFVGWGAGERAREDWGDATCFLGDAFVGKEMEEMRGDERRREEVSCVTCELN